MYVYIHLAVRFFRALHLNIFEQPSNMGFFNNPSVSYLRDNIYFNEKIRRKIKRVKVEELRRKSTKGRK